MNKKIKVPDRPEWEREAVMADNADEIKTEENKEKKFQLGIGTVIVVAMMILAAVLVYVNFIADKTFSSYKVLYSATREDDGNTRYISYDKDKVIKYSHDGITAINSKGESIWSASYNMKNPMAVTCGESVAVADIDNRQLIIYNQKGNAKEVEILNPIRLVAICEQGIAAVVTEDENCNYIDICDGDTLYTQIKTRAKEDGYPVAIAYSPDGKKLVTSYVQVNGEATKNMLTFYNFSDVGKNYDSDIVKAEDFGDKIIPQIAFVNESHVAVFASDKAYVYEMKEIPSLVFETDDFKKGIKSVAWDDTYITLVAEDEANAVKRLYIFSLNGKKTGETELSMPYKDIIMSGEDILLYNDNEVQIITKNGNEKLHLDGQAVISYMMPYPDKNKYFIIDADNVNLIKLERGNA